MPANAVLPLPPRVGALDLGATLQSGQAFRWRTDHAGGFDGVLGRDLVRLSAVKGGVRVVSAPAPPAALAPAIAAFLRLDDDMPAIQRALGRDPECGRAIAAHPGLRLLRQDPWETLAAFILSSVSNIPRISRTIEAIAAALGDPIAVAVPPSPRAGQRLAQERDVRHAFPSAGVLAAAGEARLRELGCGFRAPYLARAAARVASGDLPLVALRVATYDDARATLMALDGVGDKVADCVMLFALDKMEAFPVDRWVQRALVDWYGLPPTASYAAVRQWARDTFGPNAGYANQYLFWDRRAAGRPPRVVASR